MKLAVVESADRFHRAAECKRRVADESPCNDRESAVQPMIQLLDAREAGIRILLTPAREILRDTGYDVPKD
jgi:hypothetical protein